MAVTVEQEEGLRCAILALQQQEQGEDTTTSHQTDPAMRPEEDGFEAAKAQILKHGKNAVAGEIEQMQSHYTYKAEARTKETRRRR